jgi:nickel/cobalt exporter
MMEQTTVWVLLATAAATGFVHTILGPDHYIPFMAMSRVGRWSFTKTIAITMACGVGHVLSSVALGALGIALGWVVTRPVAFEAMRGDLAGWLLLGFGLAYTVWGIRRAIRNQPHTHVHAHVNGRMHTHEHSHSGNHAHVHADEQHAGNLTPWILFTIFVFGPCEPLIPQLIYPAAKLSLGSAGLVALVFGVVTIATMTAIVMAAYVGLGQLRLAGLTRYSHALAGLALAACGAAIKLGL